METAATINVNVHFTGDEVLRMENKTIEEVIQTTFIHMTVKTQPVKIVFPKTGKTLYFDRALFYAYMQKEITQQELIEATQCKALYRNRREVQAITGESIEPGSLFMHRNDVLILTSSDQHLEVSQKFIQIFDEC